MKALDRDENGIIVNLGILTMIALVLLLVTFIGWLMHDQGWGGGFLWDLSWLFFAGAIFLLVLRIADFRVIIAAPIVAAVVWILVVM
jgi:hypothetical protein